MAKLEEKINQDLVSALKNKEPEKASALRLAKAAIKNSQIAKGGELSDPEVITVIQALVKQRQEAADLYQKGGRAEKAVAERAEIEILKNYLPTQLPPEELNQIIDQVIKDSAAQGLGEMGKVMGKVMEKVAGRADGREVSQKVREKLGKIET